MVPSSPKSSRALLHVFNRYLFRGGEELIVDKIHADLATMHDMTWCRFDSAEWTGEQAPSTFEQARRLFYNRDARSRFESALDASGAGAAVFHNIHPVGSPSLYHAALQRGLPVVQFLHNYRPFSVGGTLQLNGKLLPDALYGSYWREVRAGAWQNSVVKSAMFAVMLKALHRSGWLKSVKAWVTVSDFMRQRIVDAGALPAARVHTLRHAWNALPMTPVVEDAGYYLFLGRLVESKGVIPLLDAWDELRARLGDRTPLLHIAGEGPLAHAVQQRLRSNPYINQLGHISGETKREAIRRCRAVIVPSTWWEPLGLVVYEAYDYAKPVLAAKSGGLNEIVQHGVTGLQHEPGDVRGIVTDVLAMEATPATARLVVGRAGRLWLLRETSTQAWLQRFEEILAEATRS
ncbi:MAG: glycosyltransferase family 4 protein [Prosthecobacter sp.]|uniref:glycosyltransferase family 4 protein n=1 Tax=Prosthecobacter sp. TaxID=1965333 RepID=UPI0039004F2A